MSVTQRNKVRVTGDGPVTMIFAHGFGCDQSMWRLLTPSFSPHYRIVTFDLVGSGQSDLSAYDSKKYSSLEGYADDLIEIAEPFTDQPVLFVGHSVSAMIGLLADIKAPQQLAAHVMVGPSPSYINDSDYFGGFTREDIDSLLETMEANYLGWSSTMAPVIMGAPGQPELGVELTNSFCRTDPDIAKQFARVTFLSDNRSDVSRLRKPTLILQSSEDLIAPRSVGEYLSRTIPNAQLRIIENLGHCPHLSEPAASVSAIKEFVAELPL